MHNYSCRLYYMHARCSNDTDGDGNNDDDIVRVIDTMTFLHGIHSIE